MEPRNFNALISSERLTILGSPALRFLKMIIRLSLSGPPLHKIKMFFLWFSTDRQVVLVVLVADE